MPINPSRTWLSPARLLEAHKGDLSYFSLENQIFSLDIFLFSTHELFRAHFPGGIITFRTPQHTVSEGPAMVPPKERKLDREISLSGLYFDKVILLERIDVSTPTCSHNKSVSIYSMNKYSNINVSLYIQMCIINSCCKKKGEINNKDIASLLVGGERINDRKYSGHFAFSRQNEEWKSMSV